MRDGPEATYKIGNATVRIHGNVDPDKLKAATVEFLKSVERQKKSKEKEAMEKGAWDEKWNKSHDLHRSSADRNGNI